MRYTTAFLAAARTDLASIEAALAAADLRAAADLAHRLKGSARTIGAMRLGETCRELERLKRHEDQQDALTVLARVKTDLEAVAAELAQFATVN